MRVGAGVSVLVSRCVGVLRAMMFPPKVRVDAGISELVARCLERRGIGVQNDLSFAAYHAFCCVSGPLLRIHLPTMARAG